MDAEQNRRISRGTNQMASSARVRPPGLGEDVEEVPTDIAASIQVRHALLAQTHDNM